MKAYHKILLAWCGSIATFFMIAKLWMFMSYIDYFNPTIVFNDGGCVRSMAIGTTEDQTRFDDNSIIMNEWHVTDYKPYEDRPGYMYVASGFESSSNTANKSTEQFVDSDLMVKKLLLQGFPDGVDFHPHGIYVHKPDNTLYVINHAYERGGERIEVFQIITQAEDEGIPTRLDYLYSITDEWMQTSMNGILNSLIVVERNKFYVTQYEAHAQDRSDDKGDGWLLSQADKKRMNEFYRLVMKPRETGVWYCEYDNNNKKSSPLNCRMVADGFVVANGITHNVDYTKIFVADSILKSVTVFDRNASTNDLTEVATVKVSGIVDNLKYDPNSDKVYAGIIANHVYNSFKNVALYPRQEKETSTSAVDEIYYQEETTNKNGGGVVVGGVWKARNLLSTPKLNCASNGMRMGNHLIMGAGAYGFKGILVCPMVVVEPTSDDKGDTGKGTNKAEL